MVVKILFFDGEFDERKSRAFLLFLPKKKFSDRGAFSGLIRQSSPSFPSTTTKKKLSSSFRSK